MEDDWESAANKPLVVIPDNLNKWAGEDDDEDVKDSWDLEDEEEEEKKDEEKSDTTKAPGKTKPNKALKSKLAEQERLAEEEEAQRLANMTPEEKLAEKLRLEKIQQESDLKSALETFGVSDINTSSGSLDAFNPQTTEQFKEFGATLSWKLAQYKESPHFPQFVEDFVRSISVHLTLPDLKKLKISVENLHTEKAKLEKQNAKKPASKAKGKITLKKENDAIEGYTKYGDDYNTYDDYDDFM